MGIGAITNVIAGVVAGVFSVPAAILGAVAAAGSTDAGPGAASVVVITICTAAATILTLPLVASVYTLIYIDRRMRAEGLDVHLLQIARSGPGPEAVAGVPITR